MRLICAQKQLLKRFIDLVFARFLISGVLNTGITYLLYLGFLQIASYRIAYTTAFVLGIFISYGLNALFVFRAGITLRSLIRFPLVYLVQYVLGLVLMTTLIEFVGIAAWLAPMFVVLVTVPLTFVLSRTIFSSKKKTEVSSAS
jgi:putative flippase GtrA